MSDLCHRRGSRHRRVDRRRGALRTAQRDPASLGGLPCSAVRCSTCRVGHDADLRVRGRRRAHRHPVRTRCAARRGRAFLAAAAPRFGLPARPPRAARRRRRRPSFTLDWREQRAAMVLRPAALRVSGPVGAQRPHRRLRVSFRLLRPPARGAPLRFRRPRNAGWRHADRLGSSPSVAGRGSSAPLRLLLAAPLPVPRLAPRRCPWRWPPSSLASVGYSASLLLEQRSHGTDARTA